MIGSLALAAGVFAVCALAIAISGVRLTYLADRLADRTGWGEAVMGAAFLGGVTSLGGTVVSVSAAAGGYPDLSVSNAIGGIAAQTVFLVVADFLYGRANLEHAAASSEGLIQAAWLVVLLAAAAFATVAPPVTLFHIHPISLLLPLGYIGMLRAARAEKKQPMWYPRRTDDLKEDTPAEETGGRAMVQLWLRFALLAAIMGTAGYFLEKSGVSISETTGITQTFMGALLTSTVTSLPELVTTVAAVRQGALGLAVGGIVGGNTFDILFLSLSDAAYLEGSLYHAAPDKTLYMLLWAGLLAGILLLGLINRERSGPARIGYDGLAIGAVYLLGVTGIVYGL